MGRRWRRSADDRVRPDEGRQRIEDRIAAARREDEERAKKQATATAIQEFNVYIKERGRRG